MPISTNLQSIDKIVFDSFVGKDTSRGVLTTLGELKKIIARAKAQPCSLTRIRDLIEVHIQAEKIARDYFN